LRIRQHHDGPCLNLLTDAIKPINIFRADQQGLSELEGIGGVVSLFDFQHQGSRFLQTIPALRGADPKRATCESRYAQTSPFEAVEFSFIQIALLLKRIFLFPSSATLGQAASHNLQDVHSVEWREASLNPIAQPLNSFPPGTVK